MGEMFPGFIHASAMSYFGYQGCSGSINMIMIIVPVNTLEMAERPINKLLFVIDI